MNKLSLAVICALGLGMTAVSAEEADVVVVGSASLRLLQQLKPVRMSSCSKKCRLSAATRSEPKAV